MKNDLEKEEYYLNALSSDHNLFTMLPPELINNKEFILKAIEIIPYYYHYHFGKISEELRNDKDVILKLVEKHAHSMCYASRRLLKDYEVALTCLKQKEGTFEHLSYELVDELVEKLNGSTDKNDAIKYLEKMILKEKLGKDLSNNNVNNKKPKI